MKVILDNVRSALNVGSIFRTCDAMGVQELILCGITATPPSREIHKTALGAELTVPFRYLDSTVAAIDELRAAGYCVVAVEQASGSVMLQDFEPQSDRQYVYVMGNEVDGVSSAVLSLCDQVIEIPQLGQKKSLNVSVAAGMVLWQVRLR
ncbi:MAG: RNA methyltransferase [Mucinivorans sp.]